MIEAARAEGAQDVNEGLQELGVPVLNMEVDCVDSRTFADGPLRTRLQVFAEMRDGRPSPWG